MSPWLRTLLICPFSSFLPSTTLKASTPPLSIRQVNGDFVGQTSGEIVGTKKTLSESIRTLDAESAVD